MKILNITLFGVLLAFTVNLNAQVYSINWSGASGPEIIQITIDLDFLPDAIYVEKEIASVSSSTTIEQGELLLLGNYTSIGSNVQLNYVDFNYFLIPFDPEVPFYSLDKSIDPTIETGILYIDGWNASAISIGSGGGDLEYWCTCGGHTADSQGPGGCLSSYTNGIIRCVNDSGCSAGCVGSAIEGGRITSGGGILIQVPKEKVALAHNFNSSRN